MEVSRPHRVTAANVLRFSAPILLHHLFKRPETVRSSGHIVVTDLPSGRKPLYDGSATSSVNICLAINHDALDGDVAKLLPDFDEPMAELAQRLSSSPGAVGLDRMEEVFGHDCACDAVNGLHLRVIISDDFPITSTQHRIWARQKVHYNIPTDDFVEGPCGIVIRWDIGIVLPPE